MREPESVAFRKLVEKIAPGVDVSLVRCKGNADEIEWTFEVVTPSGPVEQTVKAPKSDKGTVVHALELGIHLALRSGGG